MQDPGAGWPAAAPNCASMVANALSAQQGMDVRVHGLKVPVGRLQPGLRRCDSRTRLFQHYAKFPARLVALDTRSSYRREQTAIRQHRRRRSGHDSAHAVGALTENPRQAFEARQPAWGTKEGQLECGCNSVTLRPSQRERLRRFARRRSAQPSSVRFGSTRRILQAAQRAHAETRR